MRPIAVALGAAVLITGLAGCDPGTSAAPPPTDDAASTSVPTAKATTPSGPVTDLDCADSIATATRMSDMDAEVLGSVALPTRRAFGPEALANGFVKHGLLVHPGVGVELVVPPDLAAHVTMAWGTPGVSTTHLRIPGCATTMSTAPSRAVMSSDADAWLAFTGGYTVDAPLCLPLIVRHGSVEQTVHIGLGVTCPGQDPPDTAPPSDTGS